MQFHPRADWGAREPDDRNSIGEVYGCSIHWHGPGLGAYTHGECAGIVRSMQDYHMDQLGWDDLGYSLVACRHGHVYEGRGLGVQGAHAGESDIGGNEHWYGVQAMVGEGDDIPATLLQGLQDAINYCRQQGGAGNRVNGHRDHHATQCPGDELYEWATSHPMRGFTTSEEDDLPSVKDVWNSSEADLVPAAQNHLERYNSDEERKASRFMRPIYVLRDLLWYGADHEQRLQRIENKLDRVLGEK